MKKTLKTFIRKEFWGTVDFDHDVEVVFKEKRRSITVFQMVHPEDIKKLEWTDPDTGKTFVDSGIVDVLRGRMKNFVYEMYR